MDNKSDIWYHKEWYIEWEKLLKYNNLPSFIFDYTDTEIYLRELLFNNNRSESIK